MGMKTTRNTDWQRVKEKKWSELILLHFRHGKEISNVTAVSSVLQLWQ